MKNETIKRQDDFESRRGKLKSLSDAELKERFWSLTEQIVDPLLKLGYENTSPAIERSVLLRMGFSSLEVKPIVDGAIERGLLGHGAGNIVYRLSKDKGISIREAGLSLIGGEASEKNSIEAWDSVKNIFAKGGK